jgi:hypothetical protein
VLQNIIYYTAAQHEAAILGNLLSLPSVRQIIQVERVKKVYALNWALEHKCRMMVNYLMTGNNVDMVDSQGWTPLAATA